MGTSNVPYRDPDPVKIPFFGPLNSGPPVRNETGDFPVLVPSFVPEAWQPKKIKSIYAAGPIDAVTKEQSQDWQEHLANMLPDILVFSPAHPYFNASFDVARTLDEINRAAIRATDATVAYLPTGRTVFGTIREIEYAKHLGKVVVVVSDVLSSFLKYDLYHVPSLVEAAHYLNSLTD